MDINELKNLNLRLLGYYYDNNQKMNSETERVEEAQALSELLSITFEDIYDVNEDEEFQNALKHAVFLLRDRESNLYAYWPKEKSVRLTNVVFNRDSLKMLPLEYKSWFTPGDKLVITELGASTNPLPERFFYDYLRGIGSIGKNIRISSNVVQQNEGIITGELVAIGKNFIRIKDKTSQGDVIVSDHMCMWIEPKLEVKKRSQINETLTFENDLTIPSMGVVTSFNKKGLSRITTPNGLFYAFFSPSLLDEPLKVAANNNDLIGRQVVFTKTKFVAKNGKKYDNAISIHAPGTISELFALSDKYYKLNRPNDSKNIIQHIIDVYPDNEQALERLERFKPQISQKEHDFLEASKLINESEETDIEQKEKGIKKGIKILEELIASGDKTVLLKSIHLKAKALTLLYNNQEDYSDEKDLTRTEFKAFIEDNYKKFPVLMQSYVFRINHYSSIGCEKEVNETIDMGLQDSGVDPSFRSVLLYYKARSFGDSDKQKALPYAKESLYLMPFNNYAEYFFLSPNDPVLSAPVNRSLLIEALFKQDIGEIESDIMKQVSGFFDKETPAYMNCLLKAGHVSVDSQGVPSKKAVGFFTEYIALKAKEYAKTGNLNSALYFWKELFKILPGFGYYSQNRFAEALSYILDIDIHVNKNLYSNPWENKKSWQELIMEPADISSEQWSMICYITQENEQIQSEVFDFVHANSQIKESYMEYAGKAYRDDEHKLVIKSNNENDDLVFSIKQLRADFDKLDKIEEIPPALEQLSLDKWPFKQQEKIEKNRISQVKEFGISLINKLKISSEASSKIQAGKDLVEQLGKIEEDVWRNPSRFAVEGLLFAIHTINSAIAKAQESLTVSAPRAELSLTIKDDEILETSDGYFFIKGEINNDKSSLAAQNVKLSILSDSIDSDHLEPIVLGSISSGRSESFSFKVKLAKSLKGKESHLPFKIECTYREENGFKDKHKTFQNLQVHLFQNVPFTAIENNPYKSGVALKPGDPTFFGREKEIKDLVDKVIDPQGHAAQIIVYGQKRCGKSTLVQAVIDRLQRDFSDQVWCVYISLTQKESEYYTNAAFYLNLLRAIEIELKLCREDSKPIISVPTDKEMKQSDSPTNLFMETISNLKMSMASTPGWENRQLALIIDEFTAIYGSIRSGKASEGILSNWKAIQETESSNFATIFVGHDITPRFLGEPYAVNASQIIELYPLTYLSTTAAKKLIVQPILNNGVSRFDPEAANRIIHYTGRNPYYLQIFMRRMVNYINENEIVRVSATDVDIIAQRFITREYDEFNSIRGFDSLINCGISDKYYTYTDKQIETLLRCIAIRTNQSGWCSQDAVKKTITSKEHKIRKRDVPGMLDDLDKRKVIRRKRGAEDNRVVIQIIVGLFKEWLNNNK